MPLTYELRDQTKIYLIGEDLNQIIGSKLLSNSQALKILFYNLKKVKLNIRQSASLVIKETIVFWEKARIPTRDIARCIDKLECLYIMNGETYKNTLQEKMKYKKKMKRNLKKN